MFTNTYVEGRQTKTQSWAAWQNQKLKFRLVRRVSSSIHSTYYIKNNHNRKMLGLYYVRTYVPVPVSLSTSLQPARRLIPRYVLYYFALIASSNCLGTVQCSQVLIMKLNNQRSEKLLKSRCVGRKWKTSSTFRISITCLPIRDKKCRFIRSIMIIIIMIHRMFSDISLVVYVAAHKQ